MIKIRNFFVLRMLLFLLILFGVSDSAYAIGDSGGGGCDLFNGPFGDAVRKGGVSNVMHEINMLVDDKERQVDIWEVFIEKVYGTAQKKENERRREETQEILKGNFGNCMQNPLLDEAANAGNLEVVNFLLNKPMGIELADPDFFR